MDCIIYAAFKEYRLTKKHICGKIYLENIGGGCDE